MGSVKRALCHQVAGSLAEELAEALAEALVVGRQNTNHEMCCFLIGRAVANRRPSGDMAARRYEKIHVEPASVRGARLKTGAYRAGMAPISQYQF